MDHTEAVNGGFVEQYLLGELNPAQRDTFEEHFFDCPICAEDVRTGAVFVDNARDVLRSEETAHTSRVSAPPVFAGQSHFARFGLPFQSAAFGAVALLALLGYQNVVTIPHLKSGSSGVRTPEVLPLVSLVGLGSRAASQAKVAPAGKDFEMELEIPGGPNFTGYTIEVRGDGGQVKFSLPVTPEQAKDSVRLAIPGAELTPGKYEIVVSGNKSGLAGSKLAQYALTVQ
jgi:hypothetical protein